MQRDYNGYNYHTFSAIIYVRKLKNAQHNFKIFQQ